MKYLEGYKWVLLGERGTSTNARGLITKLSLYRVSGLEAMASMDTTSQYRTVLWQDILQGWSNDSGGALRFGVLI